MIWLVILEAATTPRSPDWAQVSGGTVLFFCRTDTADAAEITARSHLLDLGWTVSAVRASNPCTPDYIRLIQTEARAALAEAAASGIGIFVAATPRTEQPGSPATIQPLHSPSSGSKTRH